MIIVERFVVKQIADGLIIILHSGKDSVVQESHVNAEVPFRSRFPFQIGVLKFALEYTYNLRIVFFVVSGGCIITCESVGSDVRVACLSP